MGICCSACLVKQNYCGLGVTFGNGKLNMIQSIQNVVLTGAVLYFLNLLLLAILLLEETSKGDFQHSVSLNLLLHL